MRYKKILISLVILTLLSLFFFISDYRAKIANATITRQQLSLLETLDIFTDTNSRLAYLVSLRDKRAWLHLAKISADTNANVAYQLGEYFQKLEQLELAKLWYRVAIRQQHITARIALAEILFKQHAYQNIKPLLLPIVDQNEALALLYKLALQQGDIAFIQSYKSKLAKSKNIALYRELQNHGVFSPELTRKHREARTTINVQPNLSCAIDIQLFATSLSGLRHSQQLMSAFENHDFSAFVCLKTAKYIPAQAINCRHLLSDKISCSAQYWDNRADITTRFLGVIVEQGGANVDNGIMYLDEDDDLDVLVHELSHLLGFVDEYPLPSEHQKCQENQSEPFSHNVVVLPKHYQGERVALRESILRQVPWASLIKSSVPILTQHKQGWTLLTPQAYDSEIGIFKSASCNNQAKTQAYKPLAQRTKLQYFELKFPQHYIAIMNLAAKLYLMPSYHFNISRDLVEQGDYERAREVLNTIKFD